MTPEQDPGPDPALVAAIEDALRPAVLDDLAGRLRAQPLPPGVPPTPEEIARRMRENGLTDPDARD